MKSIIVISGTMDGRYIASKLNELDIRVTATVTTSLGKDFLSSCPSVDVLEGKLTEEDMERLIEELNPICLVDASHPYAKAASENAIAACKKTNTVYLRFERKETCYDSDKITVVNNYEEAVELLNKQNGNILLTTGSNNLEAFIKVSKYKERLYARVLPESTVLSKCEALGLNAKNIIAIKGPFNEEMNIAMLKYCDARFMVMKDSGSTGGSLEKLNAAERLNVDVIIIKRPDIDYAAYGDMVKSIDEVIEYVKKII